MSLTRFIAPLNARAVLYNLASVVRLLSVAFALPGLWALIAGEFRYATAFFAITASAFLLGQIGRRGPSRNIEAREALVVTALIYLAFTLLGAFVFLPFGTYLDGLFETMSGITTTGLSVMPVTALPSSLLFFRALSQWLGGVGIIVLSLVVLFGPGRAAFKLYASEFGEENLVGSVVSTARIVSAVYLIITGVVYIGFVLAGMSFFEALLHTFSAVSTGGFSPFPSSIGVYDSALINTVVTLAMVLGAVSFPLLYLTWRDGWRQLLKDLQLRTLLTLLSVGTLLFLAFYRFDASTFSADLFHATSALTGTGFSVGDATSWPAGATLVAVILMFIGGSAGSTTGGIKLLRLLILTRLSQSWLLRSLLPEEAQVSVKVGGLAISDDELNQTVALLSLYLVVALASSLVLMAAGAALVPALFEAVSALCTVGLSLGVTSPDLPFWAKLTLIFNMWVGRLEILPVLVLLYPSSWRSR